MSDDEIERVADVYSALLLRYAIRDSDASEKPKRLPGEDAATYLDRLLKFEAKEQIQRLRDTHKKLFAQPSSLLDQVRKSSSALGSTLSEVERLTKGLSVVEVHKPETDHFNVMNEQFARQRRERAEELDIVRLTGKMAAESAKTLKDLAEAAAELLEQLDERDRKTDQSTRKQITIAVWSVGVTAVLALLAVIVSVLSYYQDQSNNRSGDKWQAELTAVVRQGNLQRATAETEHQRLNDQVTALQAKITRMEKVVSVNSRNMIAASKVSSKANP